MTQAEWVKLFVQQPTTQKPSDRPHCPHCQSLDVEETRGFTTLVGGDRHPDRDPNHRWNPVYCRDCHLTSTRELKDGMVWYTGQGGHGDGRVLEGLPGCFEHYVLTHVTCHGDVVRRYTDEDGVSAVAGLTSVFKNEKWVHEYRTFWNCVNCGVIAETGFDHYTRGR